MTASKVSGQAVVLSVGDTTYLDHGGIYEAEVVMVLKAMAVMAYCCTVL